VPLNREAKAALLAQANRRAQIAPSSPWVFCRGDGSRIVNVKKGFAAVVQRAGLKDVHPHDLRRTFGSWLIQQGVGIERVCDLMRHSDISVTYSVYAYLRLDDLTEAVSVLDRQGNKVSRSLSRFPTQPLEELNRRSVKR
jgi:integrase